MKIILSAKSLLEMEQLCSEFLGRKSQSEQEQPRKAEERLQKAEEQPKTSLPENSTKVRAALTTLMQNGQADIAYALLEKYNAKNISELDSKHYEAILQEKVLCSLQKD